MRTKRYFALATVLSLLVTLGVVACGDDEEEVSGGAESDNTPAGAGGAFQPQGSTPLATEAVTGEAPEGKIVNVTLQEFSILTDKEEVVPGKVSFVVTNGGPDDEHELVVIKTDLAPDELPTGDDGAVDEDQVDVVDEIEPFPVNEKETLTVDLEPGSYVLICNIVEQDNGETESHYQLGMRKAFAVQ